VSFSQFMRNAVADYVVKKGYRDNKPNNKTDLPTTF
jgi:hypothetical protein